MRNLNIKDNAFVDEESSISAILKGLILSAISVLILSFVPALLLNFQIINNSQVSVFVILALFISSLIGGFKSAVSYGKNGMFIGILVGIGILIIEIVLGSVFQTISFEMVDVSLFLIKCFGLMLFGAIGGIIGINIKYWCLLCYFDLLR